MSLSCGTYSSTFALKSLMGIRKFTIFNFGSTNRIYSKVTVDTNIKEY